MFNFLLRLFTGNRANNETKSSNSSLNKSVNETKRSNVSLNKSVTDGYKFGATMLPSVPLTILKRHGELARSIPESDQLLSPAHGIWLQQLNTEYAELSKGRTMWSPVGKVPTDGGDILPYLIKIREIIEQPISSPSTDIAEALNLLTKIKEVPGGRSYEYDKNHKLIKNNSVVDYFPMVFVDDNHAIDFILQEIGAPTHDGLTMDHILELHAQGYESIMSMIKAPDKVLLSLKGIGKKKLDLIHGNITKK